MSIHTYIHLRNAAEVEVGVVVVVRILTGCIMVALVLLGSPFSSSQSTPGSQREVVAQIIVENGQPVITEGKIAAIDKGSNDGITEGDLFVLKRPNEGPGKPTVVAIVSVVFPESSILQIPGDRSGTTIMPTDVFVHVVPNGDQVLVSPQVGHAKEVTAMAFSVNDDLLASGAADGLVKIWSIEDGRLRMTLRAGISVTGIEFTPDKRRIVTATEDKHNNLKVWNLENGKVLTSLLGHNARLNNLTVSSDGRLLASSDWDQKIILWDLTSYKRLRTCEAKPESLDTGLTFSADGKFIFASVAGFEHSNGKSKVYRRIRFWSTVDCTPAGTLDAQPGIADNEDDIHSITSSSLPSLIAAGDHGGAVRLWDFSRKHVVNQLSLNEPVYSVSAPPSGAWYAFGTIDGSVGLWSGGAAPKKIVAQRDENERVMIVRASHAGKMVAWGRQDGDVFVYDIAADRISKRYNGNPDYVSKIVPLADEKNVATVFDSGRTQLWKIDSGEVAPRSPVASFRGDKTCLTPTGLILYAGEDSFAPKSLIPGQAAPRMHLKDYPPRDGATRCALSPKADFVALGTYDNQVDLWDLTTQQETTLGQFRGLLEGGGIDAMAFSPDGTKFAWIGRSADAHLWDVRSASEINNWRQAGVQPFVSFDEKGDRLALSGSLDLNVTVATTLKNDQSTVQLGENWGGNFAGTAFARDGRTLAVASGNEIALWDLESKSLKKMLVGHSEPVTAIAFTNDGRTLISSSSDSTLMLWNPSAGELLCTVLSEGDTDWLAFTPDGFFDGTRAAWNLVPFHFTSAPLKVYEPEQFFNEFFQPGLLADIIKANRSMRAILQTRKDARASLDISAYRTSHLPVVEINLEHSQNDPMAQNATVRVTAIDTGSGVTDCRVFRNQSLVHFEPATSSTNGTTTRSFNADVRLVTGLNEISAYCFNHDGLRSKESLVRISATPRYADRPRAYVLSIGINAYANTAFNLSYADQDASDMTETLYKNLKSLADFQPISVVIRNEHATKAVVLYALARLAGGQPALPPEAPPELQKFLPARPQDVVLVFFAGHGMGQNDHYYLLPHDLGYMGPRDHLNASDISLLQQHGISDEELRRGFEKIDASLSALIIDACEAGKALEATDPRPGPMDARGLAQLAYDKGMYVLTAAQSREAALEAGGKYAHGLLTFALVEEGLKTRLAYQDPRAAKLDLRQWFDYAVNRVPQLQVKLMQDARGRNWNIAIVEGESSIPDPSKRSLQHPRAFYRRETESHPMYVANMKPLS